VIDVALALCVQMNLGTPSTYADAFKRLADANHLEPELAGRLTKAAGFRNLVARAYDRLDMARVYEAAQRGPADLRAFLRRTVELVG